MTADVKLRELNGRVLAVLVLYRRRPEAAAAWETVREFLRGTGGIRLRHCLIYDNSPKRGAWAEDLPEEVSVIWAPENRGTAGAYTAAVDLANAKDCDWLLLLDQDTELPADFLHLAERAIEITPAAAALVPRVRHGMILVSPAVITAGGSVQPDAAPTNSRGTPTAISSGMVTRRDAVAAALPFPDAIWLDYVDHWMFLSFARQNLPMGLIDADLLHDLSIRTPGALAVDRLRSILAAESAFYRELGPRARAGLPARRVARAVRLLGSGHFRLAGIIVQHTLSNLVRRS